jgi:two-component system cell cycle response regulator DivK
MTNKVILIVEDESRNLSMFHDLLFMHGFSTLEATDGQKAVELAQEKKPDLILMDIMLPVLNGLDAMKILKAGEGTKSIPIIALTALAMQNDKDDAFKAGCDAYVAKPVNMLDLLKTINSFF